MRPRGIPASMRRSRVCPNYAYDKDEPARRGELEAALRYEAAADGTDARQEQDGRLRPGRYDQEWMVTANDH